MVHQIVVIFILIVMKRLVPTFVDPGTGKAFVMISPWLGDFLVFGVVATVLLGAWGTYQLIEEPGRLFGRRLVASSGSLHSGAVFPK
jgi:peptidoglycan/LPS O-acetylase OafA/YrhL